MEGILSEKRPPVYFEVMEYHHFLEGTYPREHFWENQISYELMRLIPNRRDNMANLDTLWRRHGYAMHLCREDGTLHEVQSLDPGPEMTRIAGK